MLKGDMRRRKTDRIFWSGLTHALGPADDIPQLIADLTLSEENGYSLDAIRNRIFPNGQMHPICPVVVPFLIAAAGGDTGFEYEEEDFFSYDEDHLKIQYRNRIYTLLTELCQATGDGPHLQAVRQIVIEQAEHIVHCWTIREGLVTWQAIADLLVQIPEQAALTFDALSRQLKRLDCTPRQKCHMLQTVLLLTDRLQSQKWPLPAQAAKCVEWAVNVAQQSEAHVLLRLMCTLVLWQHHRCDRAQLWDHFLLGYASLHKHMQNPVLIRVLEDLLGRAWQEAAPLEGSFQLDPYRRQRQLENFGALVQPESPFHQVELFAMALGIQETEPGVRKHCARELSKLDLLAAPVWVVFKPLLNDPIEEVQAYALESLAFTRDPILKPYVLAALHAAIPEVLQSALVSIKRLNLDFPEAVPRLRELLQASDTQLQDIFGHVPAFLSRKDGLASTLKPAVCGALGFCGPEARAAVPDVVPLLQSTLRDLEHVHEAFVALKPDVETAATTLAALLQLPYEIAWPVNLQNLGSNLGMALRSVRRLKVNAPAVLKQVQRLMHHDDLGLQVQAAETFWVLTGDAEPVRLQLWQLLGSHLKDDRVWHPPLIQHALDLLVQLDLRDELTLGLVRALVCEPDPRIQVYALKAWLHLGKPEKDRTDDENLSDSLYRLNLRTRSVRTPLPILPILHEALRHPQRCWLALEVLPLLGNQAHALRSLLQSLLHDVGQMSRAEGLSLGAAERQMYQMKIQKVLQVMSEP